MLIIELQMVFHRHRFAITDHAQLRFTGVVTHAHVGAKAEYRFRDAEFTAVVAHKPHHAQTAQTVQGRAYFFL